MLPTIVRSTFTFTSIAAILSLASCGKYPGDAHNKFQEPQTGAFVQTLPESSNPNVPSEQQLKQDPSNQGQTQPQNLLQNGEQPEVVDPNQIPNNDNFSSTNTWTNESPAQPYGTY